MQSSIRSFLIACGLVASLAACGNGSANGPVYAMVTHGSIISSFWQSVYAGAQAAATRNNVQLVVFSPAVETSGPLLNARMQEALDLKPPPAGIIGTIWGDGMVDKVRAANAAKIPVVAFNVYPDATKYVGNTVDVPADPSKGGILSYSGDDNSQDARRTLMAMIQYAKDGTQWKGDTTQPPPCNSNWGQCLASLGLKQVVLVNTEATAGELDRISGATQFMTELGQQNLLLTLVVDQPSVQDRVTALNAYFQTVQPNEKILLLCLAESVVEAYSQITVTWTAMQKARVLTAASFDLTQIVKTGVLQGDLAFGVDIGQTIQGDKAIEVLIRYQHLGRQATTQELDNRWFPNLMPFPWYQTGPKFDYAEDLK